LEAIQDQATTEGAESLDAGRVGGSQSPADGSYVGDAVETEKAFEQGIVAVVAAITKLAEAEEEVDDKNEDDDVMAEDGLRVEVAETGPQGLLETKTGEQRLDQDQTTERGQILSFEAENGNLMEASMDRGSATFHGR
jgi:hypothetical protein